MVKHMMLIVQKGRFAICRQPRPRSAAHLHRVIKAFVDRLQNQWILLYILMTKECSDQTAWVCTLIWIFTVCICHKSPFPMLCIIYSQNYYRFGSALFIIKYMNLYQQSGSSNVIGWKLEVGITSKPLSCWTRIYPAFANRVDPDQLASDEANWSGSALFAIIYDNL